MALCFDLALHPSVEALLLPAPNQLAAFAYDGDHTHTLPSAVRALCTGALLLDPRQLQGVFLGVGMLNFKANQQQQEEVGTVQNVVLLSWWVLLLWALQERQQQCSK